MNFYQETIEHLTDHFQTDLTSGLTLTKVQQGRKKYGRNRLQPTNKRSTLKILSGQFTSPLVIILIVAATFSFYLGQVRDGSILFTIVVLNALVGFYQEWKSENIIASLENLVVDRCIVLRNGNTVEIIAEDLVPGDIVLLHEGDGVPADIRIFESTGFSTNEFILTGESLSSDKDHLFITHDTLPLAEIKNCVFMGTTVARGTAKGMVYATGMQTEIGRISTSVQEIKMARAPVQIEVADIAKKLSYITLLIALFIFGARLLLHDTIALALMFAVSVAAAMVPEGLPTQISVSLALAVSRLAKKNAIVKELSAAQTLGAATVIASDKTGTITKNEMTITGCYFNNMQFNVSGLGYTPHGVILDQDGKEINKENLGDLKAFFLSGYLSSTGKVNPPDAYHASWYCMGDPTEASFATLALKAGFTLEEIDSSYQVSQSFGFDSFRKRATIVRTHKNKSISFVKGSLESIIAACSKTIKNGQITQLTASEKQKILRSPAVYAENGLRIIAIAYKDLDQKDNYSIEDVESDLTFAGFVTMFDPPHKEVRAAIESVFKAKIKVFMITGDNEITAKSVAKNIGLLNENNQPPVVVTGSRLTGMTDDEVCALFPNRAIVFSRVSPDEKYRVVDLLKKSGEVIAVTGDGVNDTLSLKKADIGVAMGLNGSKVAQEAASMILLDDNFSTIVLAIKEGRTIFKNFEKVIKVNLSCNFAELTCVLLGFAGSFVAAPTPILAVQILLIDMVGEMFPILMLTYDPPTRLVMEQAPRDPKAKILTQPTMLEILFIGMVMGLASYAAFMAVFFHHQNAAANYEKAITVTFVSIIFCQYANVLSKRTTGNVFGKYLFSNPKLLVAFAVSTICTLLLVYVPLLNKYFHTSPLLLVDWLFPITAAAFCLVIFESRKKILLKMKNNNPYLDSSPSSIRVQSE